jgi:hypothetical protein
VRPLTGEGGRAGGQKITPVHTFRAGLTLQIRVPV